MGRGERVGDRTAALSYWAVPALVDGWLLTEIWHRHLSVANAPVQEALSDSALLLLPVLVCGALGAATAGRGALPVRRWRRAGLGALIAHGLLLTGLLLLLTVFPPGIP